jgi:chromatin modification-related protein VID21
MAQRQAQMQAQAGMSNGVNQMQRNGTSAGNVGFPIQISTSQQGQNLAAMAARAHPSQQGSQTNFANGSMPIATPGVPQAQMQGNLQNAQRMGPPDQMRMAMQRDQFANLTPQQQAYLRQQQMGMTNNLGQGVGMNSVPNANMIASSSNQNVNHVAMNGMPNSAGSPRMSQPNGTVQTPSRPLSSGHLPSLGQISNNIKAQYPEWAPDRIQKAAADHHAKMVNKQRQQAMSAAAGASGSSAMSPSSQLGNNHYNSQNGAMANHSPSGNAVQNYQQQLVQQQRMMSMNNQARPQVGSPGMSARPPSRSATPQNPQMQPSPVMQQPQLNRS